MFTVNGFPVDGDAGLVQLLDLAQREVIRSFADAVGSAAPPFGLRGSQLKVLSMVPMDGSRRLTDLATIAAMTKQAMGEFVADLAAGGFLTLTPAPDDRRAKLVTLTARGRQAADAARAHIDRVDDLWGARLGRRDLETLRGLLARVAGIS